MISSEDEARDWVYQHFAVSRETSIRFDRFAEMVKIANAQQNLIAANSVDNLWVRHIADSAQLVDLAPDEGAWIDLGSGPGFPGIVVALLRGAPITLCENRRLRVDFLRQVIEDLGLRHADVAAIDARRLPAQSVAVISARAFAPLPKLIDMADRLADNPTLWLLPKGKNAENELAQLPQSWQEQFTVAPSVTDDQAKILIGHGRFSTDRRKQLN